MDSNQVLIDARVTGMDGIGRYTHNLVRVLAALLPCLGIDVVELLLRSNEFQQYSLSCQPDTSEQYTYAERRCLANELFMKSGSRTNTLAEDHPKTTRTDY